MEDKKKEPSKVVEPKIEEPKSVKVDAEKLNQMLSEFNDMKEEVKRLNYTADKARLSIYDSKTKKKIIPECRLRTLVKIEKDETNVYIIKGWRMIEDTVEEQANGVFYVKQIVELILEDKEGKITREKMPLRAFEKQFKYINARIIAETKDSETDVEIAKIEIEDGRKFDMDKIFIN